MKFPTFAAITMVLGVAGTACGSSDDATASTGSDASGGSGGHPSAGSGDSAGAARGGNTGTGSGGKSGTGTSAGGSGGSVAFPECPTFTEAASPGNVELSQIKEGSGIAASRKEPGAFFMHNDSGDTARFFALSATGANLATFTLTGASASDWEDLAAANGKLYFADIGDNGADRDNVVVYRVAEPTIPGSPGTIALSSVDKFTFTYPDGPRDAETMFVDATTGDLYIVQKKSSGAAGVYRKAAPLASGVLELVASVDFGSLATSGDMTEAGDGIVIRTYSQANYFRRGPGMSVAEALSGEPCPVPLHGEPQGEAIAFGLSGDEYFTVSEGVNEPLYRFTK